MTRPMVSVGMPLLACALVVSFLSRDAATALAAGLAVALFGAAFLPKRFRFKVFISLTAGLIGCVAWLAWLNRNDFPYESLVGSRLALTGQAEEIEQSNGRTTLTLSVRGNAVGAPDGVTLPREFKAIVYFYGEADCDYYDTVSLKGKLLPMEGTPGFDYPRYLRSQGILMVVSASELIANTPTPSRRPAMYYVKVFRDELARRLDRYLLRPMAGLAKAILLGDKGDIDPVLYNRFQRAGITHMFVVSGLHISLMSGLVLAALKRLRCPSRAAALLAVAAAWLFTALTGFGLPAIRAAVMLTVVLAGTLFHRPADALNSLFLAGVGIVLWNPAAIMSGSFQLTFTATLGAVTLAKPMGNRLARAFGAEGSLGQKICSGVGLTFGCNLAMLPVLFMLFGGISLVCPLANLVAVPLLPLIVLASGMALLFSFLPPVALFCAKLAELFLNIVTTSAKLLTETHFAYLGLDYPFVPLWLLGGGALLLVAYFLRKKLRHAVGFTGGAIGTALFGMLIIQTFAGWGQIEILPVTGYGSASVALLHDGGATVVSLTDDAYAGTQLEEELRGKNVRFIDHLLLLQPDTREPSGVRYLADCLPVHSLILRDSDRFAPYAETVRSVNGSSLLRDGCGYDLFRSGGTEGDVYRLGEETRVLLTVAATRVCITNSPVIAQKMDCEILIFSGKNFEFFTNPAAKCVILCNEPRKIPAGGLPPGYYPAYGRRYSVVLRPDGGWDVR